MSVWFTSDLHIGHRLIADHRGFCPANGTEAAFEEGIRVHDHTLAYNWDAVVRHDDQVWILGDLSAGGTAATYRALDWMMDRPGHKHLIAGNHDPIHPMHRQSHKWVGRYQEAFDSVQAFARRKIAGQNVMLSHLPYRGDHTEKERFDQYRLRDCGLPLLHGHVHANYKYRPEFHSYGFGGIILSYASPQIHVGVDAWDLRPVHLDEIAEYLKSCSD